MSNIKLHYQIPNSVYNIIYTLHVSDVSDGVHERRRGVNKRIIWIEGIILYFIKHGNKKNSLCCILELKIINRYRKCSGLHFKFSKCTICDTICNKFSIFILLLIENESIDRIFLFKQVGMINIINIILNIIYLS